MSKLTKQEAMARLPEKVKTRIDMKNFEYVGWNKPARIRCLKHDRVVFPTFASLIRGALNCPDCRLDLNRERGLRMIKNAAEDQKKRSSALATWKPVPSNRHFGE